MEEYDSGVILRIVIVSLLIIGLIIFILTGGGHERIHWSHRTNAAAINNEYFQSEIILEDGECCIIKNKVTDEYFILINNAYGVSLCPIEVK